MENFQKEHDGILSNDQCKQLKLAMSSGPVNWAVEQNYFDPSRCARYGILVLSSVKTDDNLTVFGGQFVEYNTCIGKETFHSVVLADRLNWFRWKVFSKLVEEGVIDTVAQAKSLEHVPQQLITGPIDVATNGAIAVNLGT